MSCMSSELNYITLFDFFFYLVCNFYCFTNLFHMAGVIGEYTVEPLYSGHHWGMKFRPI